MKWRLALNGHRFGLFAVSFTLQVAASLAAWALLGSAAAAAAQDPSLNGPAAPTTSADNNRWQQDLASWRVQREHEIDTSDGWLTLVGLEWLKTGSNSVGMADDNQIHLHAHGPDHLGLLAVDQNRVELRMPPGGFPPDLQIDGKPAYEGPLATAGAKPSTITWHGLTLAVLSRGGRYALRIKDAESPTRMAFHGLNWYAPDPHFRVQAHWIPYTPPHIEKIPTVIGTTLDLPSPGVAEFTLDGKTIRLEPVIEDPQGKTLFFILRDQTRYDTTYEAARFLHTGLPDHGLESPGLLVIDFNRLENPPCAYTPYATCPLPPLPNRLLLQIQAGEKRYSK